MLRDGISLEDALRVGGEMGGQPEPEPEAADDPLRTLLVEHKLEKYYDALVALGAALPDDLPELEPSDLDQIGMAKLERKRLARCVAGLRGGAMAAAGEAADGQAEDDEEEGAMLVRTTSAAKASQSLKNSKTRTLSRFARARVADLKASPCQIWPPELSSSSKAFQQTQSTLRSRLCAGVLRTTRQLLPDMALSFCDL